MALQVRLFGRLQVMDEDAAPTTSLRPRAQRLLAYLLLNRHASLTRNSIAFILWPDTSEQAALGALRRALSDLRAALPDLEDSEWIIMTRDELRWNPDAPFSLDIAAFEGLIRQATPATLHEAVALYTGDLLADWDDEWIQVERERLRQLQLGALDQLVAHHRALGDYATALTVARQALALDPLAETVHRDVIALHYQAGDRAAALAAYDRLRALLREELGVEPMEETQTLFDAIAQGAPLPIFASAATGPVLPPSHAVPKLIGRDDERARLIALWEGAASGHGCMAIVSGEAGVGKSHLAHTLAEDVVRRGGLTLIGHSYRFENALPYQAITEMLRSVTNLLRHADLAPAYRSVLAHLAPDVLGAAGSPLGETPSADLRTQLFEALLQAFLALAKSQPLLLLFEDVHAAAESTLDWLTYIAPRLSESRMLAVITYRTDEVGAEHVLSRLQRRFGREGAVASLSLKPLSREANRELIGHLSGLSETQAAPVADCLFEDAGGNPFFLHELVRGLIEAGQIKVIDGRWMGAFVESPPGAKLTLPDSLRATINARVTRLSEMAGSFLRAAAVAGKVFQYEIVQRAGGWTDELALDALDNALAHGFIRASEPSRCFVFAHHLVQEAIYADLTELRRAYWHRRLAEAIQALRPHDIGALAHHFAQAGEGAQAVEYLRQTAQRAMDIYAYADALNALELASHSLDSLRQNPNVDLAAVERETIEVLLDRASLIPSVGRPLEDHSQVLQTAADLLARHPDERLQANYCLRQAELLANMSQYERAVEAALGAYECYLALGDQRGAAYGMQLAGEYKITISQNKLGRRYLEQALALYREAGDEAGESSCLSDLAWCEMNLGEVASALTRLASALALSERRADKPGMARAYYMLAMAWNYYHDADRLREFAERSLNLCREIGPALTVRPLQFVADAHRLRNELDEARAIYAQVFDEARALHDHWLEGWAAQLLGRLALEQGNLPDAEDRLLHAYKLRLESGELQNQISDLTWLSRLRLAQGQARAALDHTSQAVTRLEPLLGEVYVWEMPDAFMGHAEALSANGDEAGATMFIQRAYDTLMQFADRISDPQVRQGYLAYSLNTRIVTAWGSADISRLATQRTDGASTPADVSLATHEAGEPVMGAQVEAQLARPSALTKRTFSLHRSSTDNLPIQLTPFIGRSREVATVKQLLQQHRLLTLTGPGGCGKTRLALQAAGELVSAMKDGVWLVELASLSDPALIPQAVALALGVQEQPDRALADTLAGHLQSKEALLILDNCEHVLDASAQLAERLLRESAGLRLLATSRERLKVPGEIVWPVPSLALPTPASPDHPDDLVPSEAVLLFVDRAASVLPAFELNWHNAAAVAHICQRLDGIPLAIELAAARMRLLTVAEIAARLDDAFGLLAGGSQLAPARHQTLRATMDWSYRLLSEYEQVLFRRMAVFSGGCSLEAVEQVCTDADLVATSVLEVLSQLIDKSLVMADVQVGGRFDEVKARYRLLATIRDYAQERLLDSGESERLHESHFRYFLEFAEAIEPTLRGPQQVAQLNRLEMEHDNLRAALTHALNKKEEAEMGLRLAIALSPFWQLRDHLTEGRKWIARALVRGSALCRTPLRARALKALMHFAKFQGDYREAQFLADEALALFREFGDKHGIADTLLGLGNIAWHQSDYTTAQSLLQQSLALFREAGDKVGVADALHYLGHTALDQGRHEQANTLFRDSLALFREIGHAEMIETLVGDVGLVAYLREDYATARSSFEECLALSREIASKDGVARALDRLGDLARCASDDARAESLYTASLALYRQIGHKAFIASTLHNLGYVAQHRGDHPQATARFQESLNLFRDLGDKKGIAECLMGLAGVICAQGQLQRAARLFGAAEALREAVGAVLWPANRIEYDRNVAALSAQISEDALAAAWAEGRALSLEQAVALALSVSD